MRSFSSASFLLLAVAGVGATFVTAANSINANTAKPNARPVLTNFLIVPGQSVGDVHLGDSPQQVAKVLGKWSGSFCGAADSPSLHYPQGLWIYYAHSKAVEIKVDSKSFITQHGSSVGKTRRQIQDNYRGGNWRYIGRQNKVDKHVYDMAKSGIAFRFDGDYRNASASCQEITVNRANVGYNGGKPVENGPR